MIKLSDVSKIYRVGGEDFYALDCVSLEIKKGEFVAVRGASGSGKTTLLNILGCLDSYDGGTYMLDGVDVGKLKDEKRAEMRNSHIGFVFQDFALIDTQTVLYNVMLPLLFSKTPYKKIKAKAKEALAAVGVEDQSGKRANQLSGGQRQRVAVARAIVNSPELILADEPTGQLDTKNNSEIMKLLSKLHGEGRTVVVVTHDEGVAAYAGRQITVSDGRISE